MLKNTIVKGTFILTATGFITRFIGFFFRMFLSHTFGAEQVGLYQLIFPVYALCFSFACAGIEIALSRCVAREISLNRKNNANLFLYQALLISVVISILLGFLIRKNAASISIYILGDLRCETLLNILSYSLPFAAVHSCICGYYLGQKHTKVPAIAQFIEQLARVGSVYIIWMIFANKEQELSIGIVVLGLVIGEIFSSVFCFRCFMKDSSKRTPKSFTKPFFLFGKELIHLALPITLTRVLSNLLQSVESISIPFCLQLHGMTNAESLSTYGVFTGMALPCILFPSALTNSISTMLLPTVAEIQAEQNIKRLKLLIRNVILFGLSFGFFCGVLFLSSGSLAGKLLFDSSLAGDFIKTLAWICPFLYLNNTLISIMNGLGKTSTTFIINTVSLCVRIAGVWIGIPLFGMYGYLIGLLLSQLLTVVCSTLFLYFFAKNKSVSPIPN